MSLLQGPLFFFFWALVKYCINVFLYFSPMLPHVWGFRYDVDGSMVFLLGVAYGEFELLFL